MLVLIKVITGLVILILLPDLLRRITNLYSHWLHKNTPKRQISIYYLHITEKLHESTSERIYEISLSRSEKPISYGPLGRLSGSKILHETPVSVAFWKAHKLTGQYFCPVRICHPSANIPHLIFFTRFPFPIQVVSGPKPTLDRDVPEYKKDIIRLKQREINLSKQISGTTHPLPELHKRVSVFRHRRTCKICKV